MSDPGKPAPPVPAHSSRRSDLRRAVDERGDVLTIEELGGGLLELTVALPRLASLVVPGEFSQLRCGTGSVPLLRRPFSVASAQEGRCSFVFEPQGAGTRYLASLHVGDMIDVLGPLGIGFTLPTSGRVVAVAGGLGCAPFPLMASAALAAGVDEVTILHGAVRADRLYPSERFSRRLPNVHVLEATDDGSAGHAGSVLDLLPAVLADGADALYACGPNAMLIALARQLRGLDGVPAIVEVSLEAPMGCGFGTCLGCVLPVVAEGPDPATRWALCCREGPVMPLAAVNWDRLAALPPVHVA